MKRFSHIPPLAGLAASAALLLAAVCLSLCTGVSNVGLADWLALLGGQGAEGTSASILLAIRLPRVLGGVLAGSALAVSGALLQAALNNPLASDNVVGINAGAGFSVLLCSSALPLALQLVPIAAFAGAFAAAMLVLLLAKLKNDSRLTVILAGVALTSIFSAGMNLVLIVDPDAYVSSAAFLIGGLSGVTLGQLGVPAAIILASLAASMLVSNSLNIMALGDETAHALGMNVERRRMTVMALASLLAAAAVCIAGLLGFVGLVVPHMVRYLLGSDNRVVVPMSAVLGAGIVCLCDLVARTAFGSYELPVGIIMAFIGGPYFIYLIARKGGVLRG